MIYELSDVLNDLMEFSAAHLQAGGRLVFWLPLIRNTNHEPIIPSHPQLRLISNCEQPFNQCKSPFGGSDSIGSRNLLTYVKLESGESIDGVIERPQPDGRPEFRQMVTPVSIMLTKSTSRKRYESERDTKVHCNCSYRSS